MSGFDIMRFKVPTDDRPVEGIGALCLKRGVVSGIDTGGVRYEGTYTDKGRLLASIILEVPAGARLATGGKIDKPSRLTLALNLALDFHGKKQTLIFQGRPIEVVFEKLLNLA